LNHFGTYRMAKKPGPLTPDTASLGVRERMLLFCVGSGTDWQRAGVTGETITALVVRGLLSCGMGAGACP
jgi:hypothetical protein